MAVKIRLARVGKSKKKKYHFRIVAINESKPRNGEYLEALGFYDPAKDLVSINKERIDYWMGKGAKPSDTVKRLIEKLTVNSEQFTENKNL